VNGRHACSCQTHAKAAGAPNQTEQAAAALLAGLGMGDPQHQGIEIALANGHRYTPDLWYPLASVAVEVKGIYSHGSRQRSRLAFDQARIERPDVTWLWVEQRKASKGHPAHWRIEHYGSAASTPRR
jgi:hypothetical protein